MRQAQQENSNGELYEAVCQDDEYGVEIQPCEKRQHPLRMVLKYVDMFSEAETCQADDTYQARRAEKLCEENGQFTTRLQWPYLG